MNKTFDCVDMKNDLQQKLYKEINPENAKDYIKKSKESINNSSWINEVKKKVAAVK
jgi:hypothetical protein